MGRRSSYKVITDDVKAIRAMRERRGLSVNKAAPLLGTNKSRYRTIVNHYSKMDSVLLVIYIVEKESVKQRIKMAMLSHRNENVMRKIAFVNAIEWIKDPMIASIEHGADVTNFETIKSKKFA